MKKLYIKPVTENFKVNLESHLLTISGDETTKNATTNGEYTTSGGITLGGRGNSIWDEEEEY